MAIDICASPATVWAHITNVGLESFSDPLIFRLLGIPKPLRATVTAEGLGGRRIAYFNTDKRFIQEITAWQPYMQYSFNFNPEKGFIVGHFFDLSDGVFRLGSGTYLLAQERKDTRLGLHTTYSLDSRVFALFNLPVKVITRLFQKYLLSAIKKNCEHGAAHEI